MKVKILKTGKISDYPAEYCARLYEHGKAVIVPEKPKKSSPVKEKEPETKEEKPGKGD